MKHNKIRRFLSSALILACASTVIPAVTHEAPQSNLPSVKWELLAPDSTGRCIGRFTISNSDSIARLCFTQLPRPMKAISEGDSLVEINAGYYYLSSPRFGGKEKETVIDVEYSWPLRAVSETPESFHAFTPGGRLIQVKDVKNSLTDIAIEDENWKKWMIPADSIYRLNEKISKGKIPGPFDIVPSFKKVTLAKGTFKKGSPIERVLVKHSNPEYYKITLKKDKAVIEGASEKTLDMAQRTLERRLLDSGKNSLPCAIIEDWPDYPYRALMIDIARNFQTPETMRDIVTLMADYRMNHLHFHITDDEAWRLEIPGLPELTDVGSRRGYTLDSHDFLPDIFTGTGDPDNNLPTANGYFTRDEFIRFLQFCDSLGINVIPEIESPGHARAAIKAMEARRRKTGDETYRLIEDNDTSKYTSAQLYHDNLMNPALPGTYRFIEKVVDEIAAMYKDAGVEIKGIHLGGDEVPDGAWDGSPSASKMEKELGISGRHALQGEYVKHIAEIMRKKSIPLYGWQDICTDYDEAFHAQVAPVVGGMDCWVSPLDMEKNIAVKGVKAGYPVIISNVDFFYMDMLYSPHPEERGLFWGGFVDELRSLSGYPSKICPPQPDQKGKVIGVSGKLFAETIRSPKDIERLIFPKCFGLAERGWNAEPTYSDADFNTLIGNRELPRLRGLGVETHLRQPGIMIKGEEVYMNSPYKDAEIRFTTDGSQPNPTHSPLYTSPFEILNNGSHIRAILVKDGMVSATTILQSQAETPSNF